MDANVFVPEGIRAPTPITRRPSLFANDVCRVIVVGPIIKSLYSTDTPAVGLRTALIALVRCLGRL